MNAITILFLIISIALYVLIIDYLYRFPKKVIISSKKQFLQSLDNPKIGSWRSVDYSNNNYFWKYLQKRAVGILQNKHRFLIETVLIKGAAFLFVWCIVTYSMVYPTGYGINNFIPESLFVIFMVYQTVVLAWFYHWHFLKFDDYMIIANQEKLVDDAHDYIDQNQNEAIDKFFTNFKTEKHD